MKEDQLVLSANNGAETDPRGDNGRIPFVVLVVDGDRGSALLQSASAKKPSAFVGAVHDGRSALVE